MQTVSPSTPSNALRSLQQRWTTSREGGGWPVLGPIEVVGLVAVILFAEMMIDVGDLIVNHPWLVVIYHVALAIGIYTAVPICVEVLKVAEGILGM